MKHEKFPKTMAAVQLIGHGGLDKLVYNTEVSVPMAPRKMPAPFPHGAGRSRR